MSQVCQLSNYGIAPTIYGRQDLSPVAAFPKLQHAICGL